MARTILLSIPLFLAACAGDQGVKAFNAEPEAEILSHSDGQEVLEGYSENFTGQVSDPDHAQADLTVTWYAGDEIACESTAAESDGSTSCEILITADTTEVRLEVIDPGGAAGSDRVELSVTPTESPEAEITAPTTDGVYYSDQLVTFEGIVGDGEDTATDLVATWESSLDGALDAEAAPNDDGEVTGFDYLSEGEHAIELHVTDSTGKTGSDSVIVTVGPPNSAPSCGITAPEDDTADEVGTTVVFEGTTEDVDVSPDWLSVTWSSDKDGEIGSSTPNSSGEITFAYADLSVNTHLVSMTVTDEVGATCTDDILYSVGTAPEITITAPSSTDVIDEGNPVRFEATVGDGEDSPTDLTLSWVSDLDGEFSTQGADSTGAVLFDQSDLSIGTHSITATVTDTDGLFAQAILTLQINGLPSAPVVELTPDPADTSDDLVVTLTTDSVDPEGEPITYLYAWSVDGVPSSASSSSTLSSADTSKGQTWTVEVTPFDGYSDGPSGSDDLTIDNTAPEVSLVTISPNPATVNDELGCSYTYSDADGDADTSTIEWDIDGTVVGTGDTLSTGYVGGSVVTCTVTPNDGTDEGTADSDIVIIDNTAPVLSEVTLSPDPAHEGDTLSCTPGSTSDDDGSTDFTYTTRWTVDGTDPGETTDSLSSDFFDRDQDVVCYVTPNDGTEDGDEVESNTVIIDNTAPSISSVSITPTSPRPTDTLTCSYSGFDDIDGDSDASTYSWTIDGTEVGTSDTLSSGYAADDVVTCTVTPNDGEDDGTALSDSVTIQNTPPEVTDVTLSPSTVQTNDTITATVSTSDDDGDTVGLTYDWYVDGSLVAETGDTLDGATYFDKDQEVYVVVTPNDGVEDGDALSSDSIIVSNTPPGAPEIGVEQGEDECVALSFDGVDDRVLIDSGALPSGNDARTVSAWFYVEAGAANANIFTMGSGINNYERFSLFVGASGSSVYARFIGQGNDHFEEYFDHDTWVHGVLRYDGSTLELFLDGVLLDATTTSMNTNSSMDMVIGSDATDRNDEYLDGAIQHVAVWDTALTDSEVESLYTHAPGDVATGSLVGWWPLTDGSGNVAVDYSGSGADGDIEDGSWVEDCAMASPGGLLCTIETESIDEDGDPVSYLFEWEVDGMAYTDATTSIESGDTVPGGDYAFGDVWTCTVTPDDGEDEGTPVSETYTPNSPPEAPEISIDPEEPIEGEDDLICLIDTESTDADGDTVTYLFEWEVDGMAYEDAITTYETGDTVPAEDIFGEEEWTCTVTPDDGTDTGTPDEASVTVTAEYDCTVETYGSSLYWFCLDELTWEDAEAACVSMGAHLVTVDDSAENSWLYTTSEAALPFVRLGPGGQWWIGYNDIDSEGNFTWVDGSGSSFSHWSPGEPNNSYSGVPEDCTVLKWGSATGGWNDMPCSGEVDSYQEFICEG